MGINCFNYIQRRRTNFTPTAGTYRRIRSNSHANASVPSLFSVFSRHPKDGPTILLAVLATILPALAGVCTMWQAQARLGDRGLVRLLLVAILCSPIHAYSYFPSFSSMHEPPFVLPITKVLSPVAWKVCVGAGPLRYIATKHVYSMSCVCILASCRMVLVLSRLGLRRSSL